jgi:hypothetical protein
MLDRTEAWRDRDQEQIRPVSCDHRLPKALDEEQFSLFSKGFAFARTLANMRRQS